MKEKVISDINNWQHILTDFIKNSDFTKGLDIGEIEEVDKMTLKVKHYKLPLLYEYGLQTGNIRENRVKFDLMPNLTYQLSRYTEYVDDIEIVNDHTNLMIKESYYGILNTLRNTLVTISNYYIDNNEYVKWQMVKTETKVIKETMSKTAFIYH